MEQNPSVAIAEIKGKIAELEKYLALLKGSIEKYTAVIVEPRKHKALEFVLRNVLDNLDERWSIQVFHSSDNENWLKTILDQKFQKDLSRISSKCLHFSNLESSLEYNQILASREFTQLIPTETFLVFQTDSMINPAHKELIYKFIDYDYVGAPWPWNNLHVGNGGLSLRKRSTMLKIIDKYGPFRDLYEDQFFSVGCIKIGAKVPTREEAKEFSIEQVYHPYSFGMHKSWVHQPSRTADLCNQCEGLETLIRLQSVEA